MNRDLLKKILLVILLGSLWSWPAYGQNPLEKRIHNFNDRGGGPGGPGFMMPRPMEDTIRRLNLTEEQAAKLQEAQESYLRDTLPWRNDLVVRRFDLRDMMRNKEVDASQILAKQREISELEAKIEERSVRYQLDVRKVLTPEQLKLLEPWYGPGLMRGPHMMRGRFRGMAGE